MTFDLVIGHARQIQTLKRAIASKHLAHGYLFEGKSGVGKKQVARALAKTVLCGKGEEACGLCPSCIQFDSENHPDFLQIEPDGASIKDKQMEEFQSFVYIKPFESTTKVIVVDEAHLMTLRAQNRILKVIEEPPGHVLLIFITERMEGLLPTVLSRLQKINFNRLTATQMCSWLEAKGHDKQAAFLAAQYADGSLARALESLESVDFMEKRQAALLCLSNLHQGDVLKAFERIEPYLADKVSTISFIDLMIIWYRDALLYQVASSASLRFTQEASEQFMQLCHHVSDQQVPLYIDVAEWAKKAINANANTALVADAMLLKLTGGQL